MKVIRFLNLPGATTGIGVYNHDAPLYCAGVLELSVWMEG